MESLCLLAWTRDREEERERRTQKESERRERDRLRSVTWMEKKSDGQGACERE